MIEDARCNMGIGEDQKQLWKQNFWDNNKTMREAAKKRKKVRGSAEKDFLEARYDGILTNYFFNQSEAQFSELIFALSVYEIK